MPYFASEGEVVGGASAVGARLDGHRRIGASRHVAVRHRHGATVDASGVVVRAARVGSDIQLTQMAAMVEEAQSGRAAVQHLACPTFGDLRVVVMLLTAVALGFLVGYCCGVRGRLLCDGCRVDRRLPTRSELATSTASMMIGTGRGGP